MNFNAKNDGCDEVRNRKKLPDILKYINWYKSQVQRYRTHLKEDNNSVSYDAYRIGRTIIRNGKIIEDMVDKYEKSGDLAEAQKEWEKASAKLIRTLSKIEGMGPIRAAELFEQGINSLDDLFHNTDKLTRQQIIGLEHFHDLNEKISLAEVSSILEEISNKLDKNYEVFPCGDYRRGRAECSQIDCILRSQRDDAIDEVVKLLQTVIADVICVGSTKFKGIFRVNDESPARKLTIRLASPAQFPFLLLFHTGTSNFVKKLIKEALDHGFKLCEHSMRKISTNESVTVLSEKEIFDHIGVPYVPPESR